MTIERLTQAQLAVKELTDRALAEKRSPMVTFVDFAIRQDPADIDQRLRRCALADVLLGDGDSLSAPGNGGGRYPDLHLIIGAARLAAVDLRVFGWEYPKQRIDANGPAAPPYKVLDFPGETDWVREIEMRMWYTDGTASACQKLSIYASSMNPGSTPTVSRDVVAPSYAEQGYEGHNQKVRAGATDRQVLELVRLARDVFEHRVKPRGVAGLG